jgi:death-on-curing protein
VEESTWVSPAVVLAVHDEQVAAHGGSDGIRDERLLDSAFARPQNLLAYGDPDIFDLAGAYAAGIVHNRPFVDGNKRASFVTTLLLLALNGYHITASEDARVFMWLGLADGSKDEAALAAWLRKLSAPVEP